MRDADPAALRCGSARHHRAADQQDRRLGRGPVPTPTAWRGGAIDSHTYGFALQELAWPFEPTEAPEVAASMARHLFAGEYPNLLAMAELAMSGPDAVPLDFEFGLDLILDGLARIRAAG